MTTNSRILIYNGVIYVMAMLPIAQTNAIARANNLPDGPELMKGRNGHMLLLDPQGKIIRQLNATHDYARPIDCCDSPDAHSAYCKLGG